MINPLVKRDPGWKVTSEFGCRRRDPGVVDALAPEPANSRIGTVDSAAALGVAGTCASRSSTAEPIAGADSPSRRAECG